MEFPIEMYRIHQEEVRIKVPCEWCAKKGIVDKSCNRCGGKGVHNKIILVWKVARKTVTVNEIDRSPKNSYYHGTQTTYEGGLRYWTSMSEFYNEEDKHLHFTKEDAQKECDRRNNDIAELLKVVNTNKTIPNVKSDEEELERLLNLEKTRSAFWKKKAEDKEPVLCGSYDEIKYITS